MFLTAPIQSMKRLRDAVTSLIIADRAACPACMGHPSAAFDEVAGKVCIGARLRSKDLSTVSTSLSPHGGTLSDSSAACPPSSAIQAIDRITKLYHLFLCPYSTTSQHDKWFYCLPQADRSL